MRLARGGRRRPAGYALAVSLVAALAAAPTLALAPAAGIAAAADDSVPPMARRVARFLVEYPQVDAFYPDAEYEGYPDEVRARIRLAERENDLCHSSGEDPEAYRGCNRRDAQMAELERAGWCARSTGKSGRIEWLSCADDPGYLPDHAPAAPSWTEREIARLAWEVADFEAPCAGPDAAGGAARITADCTQAGLGREEALLDAALNRLRRAMTAEAAARLDETQRQWLLGRERGAAQCAAAIGPDEADRDTALLRCRTGLNVPRRRELELLLPIAGAMPGGQSDDGPGMDSDKSIEEQRAEFRDWELRHTERKAAKEIDAARSAGGKAAAITRYYERPYDWQRVARDTAAVAEAIARRARQVEKGRPR